MTGIQIGKLITAALRTNDALAAAVGNKVFPIVSKEGTAYPFIVYRRSGITPSYTKDGRAGEVVTVEIVVAANNYTSSVEIADMVRDTIDGRGMEYGGMTVHRTELVAADEEFIEETYLQTLTFNLNI